LRYITILVFFCSLFIACTIKEDNKKAKTAKKEPIIKEYGFTFNDYKVIRDTIRSGDTFGALLDKFPLRDSLTAHQVTEKVKDSFKIGRAHV
jgi:hypothetical protein